MIAAVLTKCCCGDDAAIPVQLQHIEAKHWKSRGDSYASSLVDDWRDIVPTENDRAPYAPQTLQSGFDISLPRGGSPDDLGVSLDLSDGKTLLVDAVHGGLFQEWNDTMPRAMQVRPGYHFLEVNGVSGQSNKMAEELTSQGSVRVSVRRPIEVLVCIRKTWDEALGVDISYCKGGSTLLVNSVQEGLVEDWNISNKHLAICNGDRIVEVNGHRGNAEQLFLMLRREMTLKITVTKV